jgi:predicted aspartyl protease
LFARRLALILLLGLMSSTRDVAAAAPAAPIEQPKPPPSAAQDDFRLPPAQIDNALEVGGEDVKAREVETRLSVPVLLNGRGPYQFIVDSGADSSAVGLRIARGLQLPPGTPAVLHAMTADNIPVDRVRVDELTVGPSVVRGLELPLLKEADLGGDGVIGIDALAHQRLMMDFEKRLIRVEDARIRERRLPGEIVITALRRRGQLILTHVTAAGLPLDAVIDTGSQITVGNLALRDRLIRRNRDKFLTIPVIGVTGAKAELQLARIAELQLGPILLRDVPMAFADIPPFKLFGLSSEPALLLGTDILQTFRRVSLDFRARKVRFQLRRCGAEGVLTITTDTRITRLSSTGGADVCGR